MLFSRVCSTSHTACSSLCHGAVQGTVVASSRAPALLRVCKASQLGLLSLALPWSRAFAGITCQKRWQAQPWFSQRAAPSHGATCQGRTERHGLAGEQSPETWGQRGRRGGGQAWGDKQWGTGWPWRPPGCKHLPRDQPPRRRPGAEQNSLSGRNKEIAPGLPGRSHQH